MERNKQTQQNAGGSVDNISLSQIMTT